MVESGSSYDTTREPVSRLCLASCWLHAQAVVPRVSQMASAAPAGIGPVACPAQTSSSGSGTLPRLGSHLPKRGCEPSGLFSQRRLSPIGTFLVVMTEGCYWYPVEAKDAATHPITHRTPSYYKDVHNAKAEMLANTYFKITVSRAHSWSHRWVGT